MQRIRLHDKDFFVSISNEEIKKKVKVLADRINYDYSEKPVPLFVCILNGAFMFAAELLQSINFDCEITFVKLASYNGINSENTVNELIGLNNNTKGRDIIVVEDIVDSGNTLVKIDQILAEKGARSIEYATLFFKPETYKKDIVVKYYAMELLKNFIVGFGLDYNQLGRNLKDIYEVLPENKE